MEEVTRETVLALMKEAGLPEFELDEQNRPISGKVVKYYREQMIYTDPVDEKEKRWTQADLGKVLGIKEIMVNLMENKNKGLDSIERRQALVKLLKIPPALLGLASLEDLVVWLKSQQQSAPTPQFIMKNGVSPETIDMYKEVFSVYSKMHSIGTAQDVMPDIEGWIFKIKEKTYYADQTQKTALLAILWEIHALCAKIYGEDICLWAPSFKHLNTALKIATELDDPDLQASTLYRYSAVYMAQGNLILAQSNIDGALTYAKNAQSHIKGAILVDAALVHSNINTDTATSMYVQKLLEQGEKYADTPVDDGVMNYSLGKYQLIKARSLMALKRIEKALECLSEAERGISSNQRRRLAYIDILRAECYINLKQPKYEKALNLLAKSFNASSAISSAFNIERITRVFKSISSSPYGNAPEVVDLGMELRDLRSKKRKS